MKIFWKESIERKINDFYGGKTVIYKIAHKKPYKSTKKINIVKTTLLPKAIHRFNVIPIKRKQKKNKPKKHSILHRTRRKNYKIVWGQDQDAGVEVYGTHLPP